MDLRTVTKTYFVLAQVEQFRSGIVHLVLYQREGRGMRVLQNHRTRCDSLIEAGSIIARHCMAWGAEPLLENHLPQDEALYSCVQSYLGDWVAPEIPYMLQNRIRIRQL